MKFPSLDHVVESFIRTVARFPFALAVAIIGTVTAMLLIEADNSNGDFLAKMVMTCALGLPMFFALHVFIENRNPGGFGLVLFFVGAAMLVLYLVFLPKTLRENDAYRYVALNAAVHLLVAFSAFYSYPHVNGFWQFNKSLFLRFLTTALFSGVLYLGLAGALLAIDNLFRVHVDEELYGHLFVFIAGIFNTFFFLGGIPQPISALQDETAYPKVLKIFTQYILLPLVMVYIVILYAYMGKIITDFELPKGWVSTLILALSVVGTLALLLVWPLREQEENRWIKIFSRFYYISLVPLLVLLFIAINKRISEYGVTVERYAVLLLGLWMSVITLYFLFSKKKNIVLIPITLFLFLMFSAFGPWNMFKVSERSQLNRLKGLLTQAGAFENGKVKKLSTEQAEQMEDETRREISEVIRYLDRNHWMEAIKPWMADSCDLEPYILQDCFGISDYPYYYERKIFHYYSDRNYNQREGIDVTGYSILYEIPAIYQDVGGNFSLNDFKLEVNDFNRNISFSIDLETVIPEILALPEESRTLEQEKLTFYLKTDKGKEVKLWLYHISFPESKKTIESLTGILLVKE